MPLTNFGAILNFAETLEREDLGYYRQASMNAGSSTDRNLFETFVSDGKKNISLIQRTRRENVTEMILEPIRDFTRDRYQISVGDTEGIRSKATRSSAISLETRAVRYYTDAAEKIRALPEVSRALKALAKKRAKRLGRVETLSD